MKKAIQFSDIRLLTQSVVPYLNRMETRDQTHKIGGNTRQPYGEIIYNGITGFHSYRTQPNIKSPRIFLLAGRITQKKRTMSIFGKNHKGQFLATLLDRNFSVELAKIQSSLSI